MFLLRRELASRSEGVDFAFVGAALVGEGGVAAMIAGMGDDMDSDEDRVCCREEGELGCFESSPSVAISSTKEGRGVLPLSMYGSRRWRLWTTTRHVYKALETP